MTNQMPESITPASELVTRVREFAVSREDGQTLAEYALIMALIAVIVVVSVALFGENLGHYWNDIIDKLQSVTG